MPQSSLFGALILLNIYILETLMYFIMMYGNFFQMQPKVFQYVCLKWMCYESMLV